MYTKHSVVERRKKWGENEREEERRQGRNGKGGKAEARGEEKEKGPEI